VHTIDKLIISSLKTTLRIRQPEDTNLIPCIFALQKVSRFTAEDGILIAMLTP
jgi:hypothetical protein